MYQTQHDKAEHHLTVWHYELTEVFPCWSSNWFLLGGSELPHLALKIRNHFETGVWRHLPQSKAWNTSVKRRRFWDLTSNASASGVIVWEDAEGWAVQGQGRLSWAERAGLEHMDLVKAPLTQICPEGHTSFCILVADTALAEGHSRRNCSQFVYMGCLTS